MKLRRLTIKPGVDAIGFDPSNHRLRNFFAACGSALMLIASPFIPRLAHAEPDCSALQQSCQESGQINGNECKKATKSCGEQIIAQARDLSTKIGSSVSQLALDSIDSTSVTPLVENFGQLLKSAEKKLGKTDPSKAKPNVVALFEKALLEGQKAEQALSTLKPTGEGSQQLIERINSDKIQLRDSLQSLKERIEILKSDKSKKKMEFTEVDSLYRKMETAYKLGLQTEHSKFDDDTLEITPATASSTIILTASDLSEISELYIRAVDYKGKLGTRLSALEQQLYGPGNPGFGAEEPMPKGNPEEESSSFLTNALEWFKRSLTRTPRTLEAGRTDQMQWAGSNVFDTDWVASMRGYGDVFYLKPKASEYSKANPNSALDLEVAEVSHFSLDFAKSLGMIALVLDYEFTRRNTLFPLTVQNPQDLTRGTGRSVISDTTEHGFLAGIGLEFDFESARILVVPKVGYDLSLNTVKVAAPQGIGGVVSKSEQDAGSSSGFLTEAALSLLLKRALFSLEVSNNPYHQLGFEGYVQIPSFSDDIELGLHSRLGRLMVEAPEVRSGNEAMYTANPLTYTNTWIDASIPLVKLLDGDLILALRASGQLSTVDGATAYGGGGGIGITLAKRIALTLGYVNLKGIDSEWRGIPMLGFGAVVNENGYTMNSDSYSGIPGLGLDIGNPGDLGQMFGNSRTSISRPSSR